MIQAYQLIKGNYIHETEYRITQFAVKSYIMHKKMQNKKCSGTGQNPFRSKGAVDKATQSRRTFLLLVVKV